MKQSSWRRSYAIFGSAAGFVVAAVFLGGTSPPAPASTDARRTPKTARPQAPAPARASRGRWRVRRRPVTVTLRSAQGLVAPRARQLDGLVEVSVDRAARRSERKPVALALVIDTSGSMSGNKLRNAKRAATRLIDRLGAGDRLSLVSFAEEARVHVSDVAIDASGARRIARRAVEQLYAFGSTCISCGLQRAKALLERCARGYQRRLLLVSDGHATSGETDPSRLGAIARAAFSSAAVITATIGVGRAYAPRPLIAMANAGHGRYYFVANSALIGRVVDRELRAVHRAVIRDATLVLLRATGLRPTRARIHLGNMLAGERRRVLVGAQLGATSRDAAAAARLWLRARLLYKHGGRQHAIDVSRAIGRSSAAAARRASRDPIVQHALQTAADQKVAARALALHHRGRSGHARTVLEQRLRRAKEGGRSAPYLSKLLGLVNSKAAGSNAAIIARRRHRARRQRARARGLTSDPFSAAMPADSLE